MKDFWGNEIVEHVVSHSPYLAWKKEHNFRKATEHARSCATCKMTKVFEYHDRNYRKCREMGLSHSSATDIRASDLCDLWEEGAT
jgi:hypothetical protein